MSQMSDVPQGPGWWQASDLKWYPPESHPNYVAAPPPPPAPGRNPAAAGYAPGVAAGPPPQAWPSANPPAQGAGPQNASEGLAVVKGILANFSTTTWLFYGGLVFAVIGIFSPWVDISALGIHEGSGDWGPNIDWKYAALLVIAVAAWLAWPTISGSQIPVNHRIGLTVAVGILGLVVLIGFYDIISFSSALSAQMYNTHLVDVDPGFGLYLYAAGVIASAVGVVRIWIQRPKTQGQVY
jgi:hypothetical protein